MLKACYACPYNRIINPINGLPHFFSHVNAYKIYFTSIEEVHLKWFLFITSNDEVVSVALHQFRMRVWQLYGASSRHLKVLYTINLFITLQILVLIIMANRVTRWRSIHLWAYSNNIRLTLASGNNRRLLFVFEYGLDNEYDKVTFLGHQNICHAICSRENTCSIREVTQLKFAKFF